MNEMPETNTKFTMIEHMGKMLPEANSRMKIVTIKELWVKKMKWKWNIVKKSDERNVRNEHEVGNNCTHREHVSKSEQSDEDSYEERTSQEESQVDMERDEVQCNERTSGEENEMEVEHSEEQSDERNAKIEHEVDYSSIFGEHVSGSEQSDEDSYEERTSEESEVEMEHDEEQCDESNVDRTSNEENTVQYHVMHDTYQVNKSKLFDNRGFQYTLSRQVKEVKYWRCAVRNKKLSCTA